MRNEDAKVDPKGNFFVACPCRDGYTCVGSGVFDIPLGEVGKLLLSTDLEFFPVKNIDIMLLFVGETYF